MRVLDRELPALAGRTGASRTAAGRRCARRSRARSMRSNRRGTSETATPSSWQRRTMPSSTSCGAVEKVKTTCSTPCSATTSSRSQLAPSTGSGAVCRRSRAGRCRGSRPAGARTRGRCDQAARDQVPDPAGADDQRRPSPRPGDSLLALRPVEGGPPRPGGTPSRTARAGGPGRLPRTRHHTAATARSTIPASAVAPTMRRRSSNVRRPKQAVEAPGRQQREDEQPVAVVHAPDGDPRPAARAPSPVAATASTSMATSASRKPSRQCRRPPSAQAEVLPLCRRRSARGDVHQGCRIEELRHRSSCRSD